VDKTVHLIRLPLFEYEAGLGFKELGSKPLFWEGWRIEGD